MQSNLSGLQLGNTGGTDGAMKIIMAIIAIIILVFILQVVWNSVMPAVFGVRQINFWQALLLLILSKILFQTIR